MALYSSSDLEQAIRERTEFFSQRVKPLLDRLDKSIALSERLEHIDPEVRGHYEALCQKVESLKTQAAEHMHVALSAYEERLVEMWPFLQEACRLERELALLLPGVAELKRDGTCNVITDSRIYKRAVKLDDVLFELIRLVEEFRERPLREGRAVPPDLRAALQEARYIARDLIDERPVKDTVFWRLESDAAIIEEFLEQQERRLKNVDLLTRA